MKIHFEIKREKKGKNWFTSLLALRGHNMQQHFTADAILATNFAKNSSIAIKE